MRISVERAFPAENSKYSGSEGVYLASSRYNEEYLCLESKQ